MAVRTLLLRSSLINLLVEIRYSLSRLQANPLTASHVPTLQALRDEWPAIQATEITLQEAISDAQAKVDAADDNLDDFVGRLAKAILTITKDDRSHPLYVHFFGKKTLSQLRKPILGGQLEIMRGWIPSLQTSEHPSLQAMAAELVAKVAAGDAAAAAKDEAKQQNRQFRDVGARKLYIDNVNGARKLIAGALGTLPHQQTGLPSDFADQFFRKETGRDEEEEDDDSISAVKARVAALEEQLAAEKERLAGMEAKEAEAAKAAAETELERQALAALEKELAEKAKVAEALKAKLAKKK